MLNEFYDFNHLSADLTQRSLDMTSSKVKHASSDWFSAFVISSSFREHKQNQAKYSCSLHEFLSLFVDLTLVAFICCSLFTHAAIVVIEKLQFDFKSGSQTT